MVDKIQYVKMFSNLLNEHYLSIGETNRTRPASHYFIDGFLTAARALDAMDCRELRDCIEKTHLVIFGLNAEKRKKLKIKPDVAIDDWILRLV